MFRVRKLVAVLIASLVVIASLSALLKDETNGAGTDWSHHGGGVDESGYSRLDIINRQNVHWLGLAWFLNLEGEKTLEATPLAIDGVLYFSGSYSTVYAVEAETGNLLWKYDPSVWKFNPTKMRFTLPVNRGVAYAEGRVFVGALDGRLIALDAKTGKEIWSVETVPKASAQTITSAPRAFNDKVIIGHAGGDYGVRGYVTAYDQLTGKQVWRFYTVPGSPEENKGDPAMELAAKTWGGEFWKTGTGGAVWNDITFDPELNQLYIGVGNAGPYDPAVRSPGDGDNLYVASIVALDADTGKYVWHYQMNPREAWDYKAVTNMITTDLTISGKPRKVLMQSPTNGFFYVLDRVTGQPISAEKTGKVTWAKRIDLRTGRPVEMPDIRYEKGETVIWPSMMGTHNWQDMSYNPQTGLVYIPYMQLGARFTKTQNENAAGSAAFAELSLSAVKEDPEDGKGALLAWDPLNQRQAWKVQHENFWNGGTLTTAGKLVFQGTADGFLTAYDAESGKRLWRFDAGLGIIAPPISYAIDGQQYISVLVGYGGSWGEIVNVGWKYGVQPRRLLTFSLDKNTALPPSAPRDMNIHPVDNPEIKIDPDDVVPGASLYMMHCAGCHGKDLIASGSPAPDLRESPIALYLESFWSVVYEGALLSRGMPQFDMLSRNEVKQIHAYIRAGARRTLRGEAIQTHEGSGRF